MKKPSTLLSIVLLIHITECVSECRISQTLRGVAQYTCNSIQELEEQGNPEMQDVSIYDDALAPAVSSATFQKTPNLNTLVIKRSISRINRDTFVSLPRLSKLIFNGNDLSELKAGVFKNLQLELLDLSFNGIIYIQPGTFFNLTNLKTLYIRSNRLHRISKGIFNNLPIERLGLSTNRIYILEKDAFVNMTNLKRLHLDGNLLSEFQSEHLLDRGNNLEILWLHNNSFTQITRETVKGLSNLRLLNLQDNRITRILPYTLENVINLEVLVLSNNSMEMLDVEVFPAEGMPNLSKLYLNDNRLSYLPTNVLGRLLHLRGVRLGGNPWQCPCLDIIMVWLNDHNVKLSCDKDYYTGTRPICIVLDEHPNTCIYNNDKSYYQIYMEASNSPRITPCNL